MTPDTWTKSSRSITESSCVEVGWAKSSRSTNASQCVEVGVWATASACDSSSCVEVAGAHTGEVLVRDTKNRDGGTMRYSPEAWSAFLAGIKAGEFDL